MDEILLANFTVLQDAVDSGDYFWHENPELKRAAYVRITDFVGWLPTAGGGADEARLTADLNAEMIEQLDRFRRVRRRSAAGVRSCQPLRALSEVPVTADAAVPLGVPAATPTAAGRAGRRRGGTAISRTIGTR
jgi:hypothetical protein